MKRLRDQLVYLLAAMFLFTGLAFAEKPHGVSHVDDLWVGDRTDTSAFTPGEDDAWVAEDFGFGGTFYPPTGSVSATAIADTQRSFPLYLPAGMQDGGNDLDDASTPTLAEVDNVPCLQWDNSTETTAAQWTFRLPPDFVAGGACGLYAIISSGAAEAVALDYAWWINGDGVTFDAAAIGQDPCAATGTYLNVSCEVLDLSANSTALAAFTAGAWVTVEVFNSAVIGTVGKVELKGLEFYYQSTQ